MYDYVQHMGIILELQGRPAIEAIYMGSDVKFHEIFGPEIFHEIFQKLQIVLCIVHCNKVSKPIKGKYCCYA